MTIERIGVVGGGIVGLAVARQLACRYQDAVVTVMDKEDRVGSHQTGHNSGVVHAGIYYKPGSLKAALCRSGMALLREYCAEHHLPYRQVGKLVVARTSDELGQLDRIEQTAELNGVKGLKRLDPAGMREIEPHAQGVAALHSPETAIADFGAVADQLARDLQSMGGEVILGDRVRSVWQSSKAVAVRTEKQNYEFDRLVICAGLRTDKVSRKIGQHVDVRIIPFRGEYYKLTGSVANLVNGLIYPVPDPRYPFLGVHLTKRLDGDVLVGPNAILALSNEGYRWSRLSLGDIASYLSWPGFWRMARRNWRTGLHELKGSLSKTAFVDAARQYVPAIKASDLTRAPAGVRAQAVSRRGDLVDDFVVTKSDRIAIVRNAPSPAATSSLAIAEHLVRSVV